MLFRSKAASPDDWFVYLDADERIEYDWAKLYKYPNDVIAIRMKLFDFYITPEDVNKPYTEREKLGPEYRKIIMAFRNLPTLAYKYLDQREVALGIEGKILDEGYVKHYGKAISVEEWEKTCDYYSNHFPMYAEKWKKRKGRAIHSKFSDFGNELITWEEKDEKGINLYELENNQKNERKTKNLNILITNHHLSGFTGSEIFTLTLAKNLKKLGHEITVYSKYIGEIGKEFRNSGIRLVENLNEIVNQQFDLAHVHHNISLVELRNVFPRLPVVFLSQGILPFLEHPPIFDLGISKYLAISEEIKQNLINLGISENEIEKIGNLIDVEEFKVDREINISPEKAIVISSRIDEEKEVIIRKACKELKISIEFIGGRFGEVNQQVLVKKMEESDIIFSLGRGAIEGIIAGRCVIIYDYLGADGIITTNTYHEIKKNNFSGRRFGRIYNVSDLKNEIKKYDVNEIKKVQELAIMNYSASKVVSKLEGIYHKVVQNKNVSYQEENLELANFINNIIHETFVYSFTKGKRHADFIQEETNSKLILFVEKLIQEKKYEAAEIILEELILENPNSLDALNDLAVVSILKNNKVKALNALDKVLTIEPTNEVAIENFSYLAESLEGNNCERSNLSNKADLDNDKFKISQAEELIQNNKLAEATEILEELIVFDSINVAALIDLSVIATLEMNFQKAKKLLTKALEINPGNETALENMIYINQQVNFASNKNKVPGNFETINCPFCGSEKSKQFRNSADIVKCMDCDTIYLRTRSNKQKMYELYQSYADGDSHMALPISNSEIKSSGLRREYLMNEILEFVKPEGNFLDIGCGWGAFLDNARDKGFTPRGIEMTKKCVTFANEKLNIKVTNEQFGDTPFEEASFSVITLNHVLEHLPFPPKAIDKIYKILMPGGMFCGIVPNINSFISQLLTEEWYWLDPNYHYVHYTPKTLVKHLGNAGFIIERLYTTSGDYGVNNVKKELKKIFNQTDAEIEKMLLNIEKNGEGEEIRFFARKPK